MTKKQDEILSLLVDIKSELEEQTLRLDEIENEMLEITSSLSADIRAMMKAAGVRRKRKNRKDKKDLVPTIPSDEWPVVDPSAVIQESDQ